MYCTDECNIIMVDENNFIRWHNEIKKNIYIDSCHNNSKMLTKEVNRKGSLLNKITSKSWVRTSKMIMFNKISKIINSKITM